MSYCRCGNDSDVYVYHSMGGGWRVHVSHEVTMPKGKGNFYAPRTRRETLSRLLSLRRAGVRVPEYALDRLRKEMQKPPDQISGK